MIISSRKPFAEILTNLKNYPNVVLTGCSECAAACRVGGEEEVRELKALLEEEGFHVPGQIVLTTACNKLLSKKELKALREALGQAQAVLSLSCGNGTQTIAALVNIPVFPANNTMFIGEIEMMGAFHETCRACGECLLAYTAAVCPVAACAKSLTNGPCGGAKNGKCETNAENDCVWITIFNRLQSQDRLECLEHLVDWMDHDKNLHPGQITLGKTAAGGWGK